MNVFCLVTFDVRDKAGKKFHWNVSLLESDMRLTINDLIDKSDVIARKTDERRVAKAYIQAGGDLTGSFKKYNKQFVMGDVGKYTLEMIEESNTAEICLKISLTDMIEDAIQEGSRISQTESTVVNAFSIIQSTSQCRRRKGFPDPCKHPKTGKDELHNTMIDVWRDQENLSLKGLTETTVDRYWKILKDLLWDFNKYRPTLPGLEVESKELLNKFLGFSHYDDPDKSKKTRPSLKKETLNLWKAQLDILLRGGFAKIGMQDFLKDLKSSVEEKQKVNENESRRVNDYRLLNKHRAEWKTVSLNKASSSTIKTMTIKPSIWGDIPKRYHSLSKALSESDAFEPIVVAEHMDASVIVNRDNRYNYLNNIRSECRSVLVRIKHSGKQQSENWIFKTGNEKEFLESDEYTNLLYQTITRCQQESRVYVTKWIKKAFACRLSSLYPTQGVRLLTEVCLSFLGDTCESSEGGEFDGNKRGMVEIAMQTGDSSLIEDARKLNGRPFNSAFKAFWEMTDVLLKEVAQAAEARRKGDQEVGYMSEILSLSHMHGTITMRLKEKLGNEFSEDLVPSLHLLHLQFLPSNNRLLRSACYTGRFNVQRKIQRRILHLDHVDAHYGNKLLQYMRSFSVLHKGYCVFISADDKARIQIGKPGQPLQTGVRNKPSLAPSDVELYCLDHDYAGTSLVPSVYLIHTLPEAATGDWYRGHVRVGLKDGIFEPSCPWRHAEELCRQYDTHVDNEKRRMRHDEICIDSPGQELDPGIETGEDINHFADEDIQYPILMLLTDGGPDRNLKRASVLASMISVFLRLDLDMLVAARTVPHLSYRNPVERVMSVLNIALQNCAFCREKNDTLDELLKGCNTMKDIRKKAVEYQPPPGGKSVPEMFKASMKKCRSIIEDRMAQLFWTNEPVSVYRASEGSEISALVDLFLSLDGEFPDEFQTKCRERPEEPIDKTEFYTSEVIKEFVEHHVRLSPYTLQIKKVADCKCTCCRKGIVKKPRMPPGVFEDLKWMPLPLVDQLTDQGEVHKYKEFNDLYGSEPDPKGQPSLKKHANCLKPRLITRHKKLYNSNKARAFIQCSACSKPRVIYVPSETDCLTKREKLVIRALEESGEYVCGAQLTQYKQFEGQEAHGSSSRTSAVDLTEEQRAEQDREFQFYLMGNLNCEVPMEEAYFKGQRLYHKRNKNICSHCGLSDNQIQQPTEQEVKDYSCVFHPCIACKKSATTNPKPIYGSKRRKRRTDRTNGESEEPFNTRLAQQRLAPSSQDDATEPSGTFSEHSD